MKLSSLLLMALCLPPLLNDAIGQAKESQFQFLDANTEYSYKVAAKVASTIGSSTSYMSRPITLQPSAAVDSVPEIGKLTLVEGTPLAEEQTVADLLPKTVKVLDKDGNEAQSPVTWDASTVDLEEVGEYTVKATVKGYTEVIDVTVEVIENYFVKFEEGSVLTRTGVMPTLPKTVTAVYANTTKQIKTVTWNTSALDVSTVGEKIVEGTVYGIDTPATIKVIVKENYIISVADAFVEIPVGTEDLSAALPATVKAVWADDSTTDVPVVWDTTAINTNKVGTYTATGTLDVEDFEGDAKINVTVAYPIVKRFDFGIDSSRTAEGWIPVTVNGKGGKKTVADLGIGYSEETGYGFKKTDAVIEGRTEPFTQDGIIPTNVYTDLVLPAGNVFLVDVEDGIYSVEMISCSNTGNSYIAAVVEGKDFSGKNGKNTYSVGSVDVEVVDGQLTVDFTSGTVSRVGGLTVRFISDEVADKAVLRNLISVAAALEMGEYTTDSFDVLTKALNKANEVEGTVGAKQSDVDTAAQTLRDAMAGLVSNTPVEQVDKTALNTLIAKAETLKAADYTEASFALVTAELAYAKAAAAKEDATQVQVDMALAALQNAFDNLVPLNFEADKTELRQWIKTVDELDGSKYTIASFKNAMNVYTEAKSISGNKDATQKVSITDHSVTSNVFLLTSV